MAEIITKDEKVKDKFEENNCSTNGSLSTGAGTSPRGSYTKPDEDKQGEAIDKIVAGKGGIADLGLLIEEFENE